MSATITVVTPNPAWDVTYTVDQLIPGEALRVRTVTARAGGKGVNVARVVGALGGDPLAVTPMGGLLSSAFVHDLESSGIRCTWVAAEHLRQSIAVVPTSAGPGQSAHPTVLNEPGAPLGDDGWRGLAQAIDGDEPGVVVISGSLPPDATAERLTALIKRAHRMGHRVYVDCSGPAVVWAADARADLVKPNRQELADATGHDDVLAGAGELLRRGAGAVVVTDGAAGMSAIIADDDGVPVRVAHARLDAAVSGNPTGAGDAAMAALAVRDAMPWADRLRLAVAASAAAVLQPVAGIVDPGDVDRLSHHVLQEP